MKRRYADTLPVRVGYDNAGGKAYVENAGGRSRLALFSDVPVGSDKQVQFNDGGILGADADFTWDKTTNKLTLGTNTAASVSDPQRLNLGGEYASAAGVNPKIRIFDDGAGNVFGIGVSASKFNYMAPSGSGHYFYVNGTEKASLDGSGNFSIASGGLTVVSGQSALGRAAVGDSFGPLHVGDGTGDRIRLYTGSASQRWGFAIQAWTFAMYMDGGNPGVGKFAFRIADSTGDPSDGGADAFQIYTTGTFYTAPQSAAPGSPVEGMIYANSTDHHLYFYNGTAWKQLDN